MISFFQIPATLSPSFLPCFVTYFLLGGSSVPFDAPQLPLGGPLVALGGPSATPLVARCPAHPGLQGDNRRLQTAEHNALTTLSSNPLPFASKPAHLWFQLLPQLPTHHALSNLPFFGFHLRFWSLFEY